MVLAVDPGLHFSLELRLLSLWNVLQRRSGQGVESLGRAAEGAHSTRLEEPEERWSFTRFGLPHQTSNCASRTTLLSVSESEDGVSYDPGAASG